MKFGFLSCCYVRNSLFGHIKTHLQNKRKIYPVGLYAHHTIVKWASRVNYWVFLIHFSNQISFATGVILVFLTGNDAIDSPPMKKKGKDLRATESERKRGTLPLYFAIQWTKITKSDQSNKTHTEYNIKGGKHGLLDTQNTTLRVGNTDY